MRNNTESVHFCQQSEHLLGTWDTLQQARRRQRPGAYPPQGPITLPPPARPVHRGLEGETCSLSVVSTQDKEGFNLPERISPSSLPSTRVRLKPRRRDKRAAFGLGVPGPLMPGDIMVHNALKRTAFLDSQDDVGRGRQSQHSRALYASKTV